MLLLSLLMPLKSRLSLSQAASKRRAEATAVFQPGFDYFTSCFIDDNRPNGLISGRIRKKSAGEETKQIRKSHKPNPLNPTES